ncbi:hypothetical protein PHET_10300, partial [Paragonimus heterotremus]
MTQWHTAAKLMKLQHGIAQTYSPDSRTQSNPCSSILYSSLARNGPKRLRRAEKVSLRALMLGKDVEAIIEKHGENLKCL